MEEPGVEPIVKRIRHLSTLVSSSGLDVDSDVSARQLVGQEWLLDALLVLYEECNNDQLKQEKCIADFVDKYRSTVHELRKLRVNLNDFEQKKVIGKGHFGIVQVVREKATGNVFALKSLRKSDTITQQHIAFYEEERDIMAKSTSSWITQLQYAFQDDLQLYLVMEFHPGGDLLSLLDRYDGFFSEDMARFYLAEITLAIHALHSMGYVHRDIKPDNILIDRCGHIKLADFGSSAKLTCSGVVRSKMPVGTADYIAPEVLQSVNDMAGDISYGIECDLWSLGIMAYEMLYGRTPFKGDQVGTTYSSIMDHKNTLVFDANNENPVSESAKDLIRNLLVDSSHRLSHTGLLQHKFFLHINWNDLRNSAPPFVPVVNGVDDTSNFEEFENEKRLPSVDAFLIRQGFTGKNLPFVGFTYNRKQENGEGSCSCKSRGNAAINISILDESIREPSYLEAQLKAQKKENHELKYKLMNMQESEVGQLIKAKDFKLIEAQCRIEFLEKERQRLEEENGKKGRAAVTYKRDLALERADRAKIESQTIELIRSMKKKWKDAETEKIDELHNKLEAYAEELNFVRTRHHEVGKMLVEREKEYRVIEIEKLKLLKMLKEKEKQECIKNECKGTCQATSEAKKQLEDAMLKLETERERASSTTTQLEEALIQINRLETEVSEKNHVAQERKIVEERLQVLQEKLEKANDELTASHALLKNAKETEKLEKRKQIGNLEDQLARERAECSRLRHQLQEMSGQLNESMASLESVSSTRSLKEEEQEGKIRELQQELKSIASDRVNLQSQLMQVKVREGEHKSKISELEFLLSRLDETVRTLESKKSSTQACEEMYRAKLQVLETQLEAARSAQVQENENTKKLSNELTEVQKQLSDSRLDMRVTQRELKSGQDTISYLRDKIREQRGQLDEKETVVQEAADADRELRMTIDDLEKKIKSREEEMEKQKADHQQIISRMEEKIKSQEDVKKSLEQMEKQLREARQKSDSVKLEKRGLESQIKMMESARENDKQDKQTIQGKVDDLQKKLVHSELVISQLKEVCSSQDEELSLMESLSEKIALHENEETKLKQDIEKLQDELKTIKAAVNEEKSLKLFQERKVKDLESRLREADQETDKQIQCLNNELQESGRINLELHEQIEALDKEVNEAMALIRNLEQKLSEVRGQRDLVEEEAAGHIQHIHTLKDSNFKLTEGLEEAISKAELYKKRIEDVEQKLLDQQTSHEDDKLKMKGTIDQQTKLIDFLQSKMDCKKKKVWDFL